MDRVKKETSASAVSRLTSKTKNLLLKQLGPATFVFGDVLMNVATEGLNVKSVAKGLATGAAWYYAPSVMFGLEVGKFGIEAAKIGLQIAERQKSHYYGMYQHFGTGYIDTEHKATMRQRGLAAIEHARGRVDHILGMEARELRKRRFV